ncbi:MAG: bifunctional phosphoribosylaminoimidazolecarboxamide formyltransferase/IMP cyclohydrolase PurH [Acidobacteria bacterium]|nr:MAG: bifunctional phosphoribosylaminoimidazolecarboxamide formyltransferase/IMP cyclohydrolase PurH [Acidobacteriota bacterium]MCL4286594.1 bifunctional phosphoribosylaminoimidazolecarboxamide formyltransferase/IMP cyclohydrolase [Thermoleophilia bacterium]
MPVRRALISVSDKSGVVEFAQGLQALGIEVVSTGGTAASLRDGGIAVRTVEELTGAPEILGGRVKTLHPRLHAALLAVRDDPEHAATLAAEGIETIDLVCVNLYPFERAASRRGVGDAEVIENIDIGGPTMIRAAAKNHRYVAIVVRPESYDAVLAELEDGDGTISAATRHWLANEAFAVTARYDAAISDWFGARYEDFPTHRTVAMEKFLDLSYGENPHQRAALYTEVGTRAHVLSRVSQEHGRDLSFNNVLDLDSARNLLADLDGPACVIVKHNNPCGVAEGDSALDAYEKALACDPVSAYGGVIALDRPVDEALARRLHENFVEVLIAPGYEGEAMAILRRKEAIRILEDTEQRRERAGLDMKRVRGGMLVQGLDAAARDREGMAVATGAEPDEAGWRDIAFAWNVCKHVRSNAIVLATGRRTIGIGAGQMSRVDSVRLAIEKCRAAYGEEADAALNGCVVASDAFFPFADGPQAAIEAGARTVVQPGGSKRDDEIIAACEEAGVTMVFTGRRHFRH